MSDNALDGLKDPERHPFPPDQKAAFLFADAMTDGPGHVPERVFEELGRHFGEAQIVEIACVVGLFNYFNRFNNALHVEITLTDPDVLARRIEDAAAAEGGGPGLWERTVEILQQGRRYLQAGIYRREGDRLDLLAHRGLAPSGPSSRPDEGLAGMVAATGLTRALDDVSAEPAVTMDTPRIRSEMAVPIRSHERVAGIIHAGSDRPAAFDDEERALLERIATILAARLA